MIMSREGHTSSSDNHVGSVAALLVEGASKLGALSKLGGHGTLESGWPAVVGERREDGEEVEEPPEKDSVAHGGDEWAVVRRRTR